MKVKVTGSPVDKLNRLVTNLGAKLERPLVVGAAKIVSKFATRFETDALAAGKSPSGKPWKPLKSGKGMANKWAKRALASTQREIRFELTINSDFAKPHQGGARKRPILVSKPMSLTLPKVKLGLKVPKLPSLPSLPKLPSLPSLPSANLAGSFVDTKGNTYRSGGKWKLPKRPMLPGKRFPRRWLQPIKKALREYLKSEGVKAIGKLLK